MGAALALGLLLGAVSPALAHGADEEADAVDLIEQALAIVTNSPEAAGEALERVEAVLALPEEERTDLDAGALEEARRALTAGDLHEAEDALISALGREPHPEEAVPEETPTSVARVEPGATPSAPVETAGETAGGEEARYGENARVDFGWRSPGPVEWGALAIALILAAAGVALVVGREGSKRGGLRGAAGGRR